MVDAAVLLGSRFIQTPTVPDSGVDAGVAQREARVRLGVDLVELSTVSPSEAARNTFTRLAEQLEGVAENLNLSRATPAIPDPLSPEQVASNILTFARGFLDQARTPSEYEQVFAEIEAGVAAGFEQAREAIDAIGQLTGEVAETVDDTERLVLNGLERLSSVPADLNPPSVASVTIAPGLPIFGA